MEQAVFANAEWYRVFIALLSGAALFLAVAGATVILRRRDPIFRRLEQMSGAGEEAEANPLMAMLARMAKAVLHRLAWPARPKQGWQASEIKRQLTRAGFHGHGSVQTYLGIKVAACLGFPIAFMFTPYPARLDGSGLFLGLTAMACLGYVLPGLVLNHLVKARGLKITRELPEVLDLLVISVEAGLGLDASIQRVAREVQHSCPTLALELAILSLELTAGIGREKALRNLHQRTGVDEVGGLVTLLIQADRFGVSVGRSLRVHSDSVRTKRRQQLEEQAAKIPLKLLFPVLFLIFPAILVVMAGPAFIKVSENLLK